MRTLTVPASIEHKYRGAGVALAAVVSGVLVDIVYLDDVVPAFGGSIDDLAGIMDDPRLARAVRELQALGAVSLGVLGSGVFTEI